MKSKLLSFVCLILLSVCFSQTNPKALKYLNAMGNNQEKIAYETWDYIAALARSNDFTKVKSKHRQVFTSVSTTLAKAKRMPEFEGSTRLRDSMISYLQFSLNVMTGRTQELIDLEKLAKKSYDKMEAYVFYRQALNKKMGEKSKMMKSEQQIFADKHGIKLIEEETYVGKKIKIANELFHYRDLMYLAFYRCSVYEQLMLENTRVPESNYDYGMVALTVSELADLSRQKLDTITAPNEDTRLKDVTLAALDFYEEEAITLLPAVKTYWQTRNAFEAFRKTYKNTAPKDRTQSAVNNYNELVAKLNEDTDRLNTVKETFNQRRAELVENWNKTAEDYIRKHTPE